MYKFNGEYWYKAPTLLKRIRKWFIWIGGWEKANCKGWHFRHKEMVPKYDYQYEEIKGMNVGEMKEYLKDKPHKYKATFWYDPTPISFFGHRITIQTFGIYFSLPHTYIVINWRDKKMYSSRNGTPGSAHAWFFGTPKEIVKNAR